MVTFWYKLRLHQAWNYKAPLIMSAIYLVIYANGEFTGLLYLLLSFCTIIGIAGIGYLTNDYGDRAPDSKAGKSNFFNDNSAWMCLLASIITIVLAFAPWFYFPVDNVSWVLLGLELLAFVVYALPPFRLKRSVYLAPFLDAAYAHVIPVLLAAYTFMLISGSINSVLLILLGGWQFLFGIRAFINHLFLDRSNDIMNYPTLATKGNSHKWSKWLIVISVFEMIVFSTLTWLFVSVWFPFFIIAIAAITMGSFSSLYSFRSNVIDRIYVVFWPLTILLMACFDNSQFWWALLIHLLLFPVFFEAKWVEISRQRINQLASYLVNHFIYFFRRFVLWQSDQKARKEYFVDHKMKMDSRKKMKETGSITLANLNKDKYSETYVHHYKTQLPFAIDFLHGGYPPTHDEQNKSLISGINQRLDVAVVNRLQKTRSRLILAHFGPMAVSMMPISKITGVPLVAYFHAYDIHHEKQVAEFKHAYQELFNHANLLLASSQEIADKLISMGAAKTKVKYLPAYFPVEHFLQLQREPEPMKVLAIGRFADTKSPHVLLIAFAKVVEIHPAAKLILIGEGELLESSMMLATALKLNDHVTFTRKQSPEEVKKHLSSAHLFVQHSATTPINRDREGTPVAVMEAMSAGLPIISTRHAGIQELITTEEHGILVEELDFEAMASQIVRCLESPELCQRLGQNAQRAIKNNPLIMDHMKIMTQVVEDYGLRI